MATPIAVALLGLGNINEVHRQNLQALPDVQITAVWDPLPERTAAVAASIGPHCRAYTDHQELLTTAPVDCAFIALPPHRHTDHEILAARRGLPFLVEKPIVRQLGQARAIEAEILRSGVLHAVGYHYRYTPHAELARETLAGATIGLVLGYTCWAHQTRGSQAPWHSWLFDDSQGGGQLHEHTTHVIDLARFLAGDVRRVQALGVRRRDHDIPGYNTNDVISLQLEFTSGALGQFSATHMTPTAYWWGLNLLSDQAIVEFVPRSTRIVQAERSQQYEPAAPRGLHYWQDSTFIEAVRHRRADLIRSTYSDAIQTTAITLAALESIARGGAAVELAELLERSHQESNVYRRP